MLKLGNFLAAGAKVHVAHHLYERSSCWKVSLFRYNNIRHRIEYKYRQTSEYLYVQASAYGACMTNFD